MFDQQVDILIRGYVKAPGEFCASLGKVVNPIRKAVFEKKNNFDAHFEPLCQSESVQESLLQLISSLIVGACDSNEYSQEAVTVAQLVTFHAYRSRQKRVLDFLSYVLDRLLACRHWKNRENLIMLDNPLILYMTDRSLLLDHLFNLRICVSYSRAL